MSDTPTELCTIHRPLKAAINGVFEPRLRVSRVKLSCDSEFSEATLQAYTGPIHPTTYHGGQTAISVAQFLSGVPGAGISPDVPILIYRDSDGDDPTPQAILRGFAEVQTYAERGSMAGSSSSGEIVVSSVLARLNKLKDAQVYGRRMRTAESIDAWREATNPEAPLGDEEDLKRVARPCTFNARGEGNRHPAPVTIGGELVYVFSDDNDPDAEPWTWAQALRYLLYFHLPTAGLISWVNVWDQTRGYASSTIAERPQSPVSEAAGYDGDPSTASELLKYALLNAPSDAVFEGMSIVGAMEIVAQATATHFRVETSVRGGAVVDDLIWWARGGGRRSEVYKDPRGGSVADVLENLNIGQMVLSANYRDVVTTPVGMGDIRRHEITVELVPGWEPDSNVDVPTDVDAAVEASEAHWDSDTPGSDPWFQKYHACGVNFPQYANVGRRWVLNETGRYPASSFARTSGQFVAAKYAPWEPASCSLLEPTFVDGEWTEREPDWTRQPRPFADCFSADALGRSLGIVVEVSMDSGTNWERIPCMVLATEAGIYIESEDLTQLISLYDAEMHWWKAMCKDQARVRVTGVIESDGALVLYGSAAESSVDHEAARMYDWRGRFKSNYRTSANSIFAPGGSRATSYQTIDCRDDSPIMDEWLAGLCDLNANRQIPGSFTIPWLECRRYRVGDCVPRVRGAVELTGAASGGVRRPPDIVAIVYSDTSTQLVLEDPGMAEMK